MTSDSQTSVPTATLWEIFTGFLTIGLLGFGGIAVSAQYIIVEKRIPEVRAGTAGAASAAAGLIIGTAVRMGKGVSWGAFTIAFAAATFLLVGIFRLPLWAIMLTLVPLSVGLSMWGARRS